MSELGCRGSCNQLCACWLCSRWWCVFDQYKVRQVIAPINWPGKCRLSYRANTITKRCRDVHRRQFCLIVRRISRSMIWPSKLRISSSAGLMDVFQRSASRLQRLILSFSLRMRRVLTSIWQQTLHFWCVYCEVQISFMPHPSPIRGAFEQNWRIKPHFQSPHVKIAWLK